MKLSPRTLLSACVVVLALLMGLGMMAPASAGAERAPTSPFSPDLTIDIPDRVFTDTPFTVDVTVTAGAHNQPDGMLSLRVPEAWTVEPASVYVPAIRRGVSRTLSFTATPSDEIDPSARVEASLSLARWTWAEGRELAVAPCLVPEVDDPQLKVPESDFSRSLEWVGPVVYDPGYTLWGASPVIDDEGRVHLFVARWPERNVDPAWRQSSEIAHYVADSPEGPFTFSDVALQGTGREGDWDRYAPHNPEIKRFGDTYVLLYIANSDYRQPPHPNNQQIGMAVADSPDGPWRKVNPDSANPGLLLAPQEGHFTEGRLLVNPTMLEHDGTYFIYFKTRFGAQTKFGVATSQNLTGPYELHDQPLTPEGVTIEDATVFVDDGQIQFLVTDNHGDVTGVTGGGAMFFSEDGYTFDLDRTSLGYRLIPDYYEGYGDHPILRVYGSQPKLERPKVLTIDGEARYLYAPSGWNVTGQDRTVVHLLKVGEDHPGEDPGTDPLVGCNLLRNGDFEAGTRAGQPPADVNWGVVPDASTLPDWRTGGDVRVARNTAAGQPGFGTPSSAVRSPSADSMIGFASNLATTPDRSGSALWQSFETVPGQTYRLTFDLGQIGFPAKPLSLTAEIHEGGGDGALPPVTGGTLLADGTATVFGNGFQPREAEVVTFTAASNTTTLVIAETSVNSNSANLALDNVSVRAVRPSGDPR
ncbi:hypothetical protein GCM10009809_12150 [Isoptericola hypogeus]|uniref:DUF642 domain-containing protein n=1 Tax=Isoptericola hypogeus TaxID=300179 RepID=A0ABN2J4E0_9MICO